MSGINAFQSSAFQQTVVCAFQEFISTSSGRRYTEEEAAEALAKFWSHKADKDSVWRHIAAVSLGRKGGLTHADNLKQR